MQRLKGLSLIEMTLALAMGLVLAAGLLQVVLSSKRSYAYNTNIQVMQDNARFAALLLPRLIRLAGYRSTPVGGDAFPSLQQAFPEGAVDGTAGTGPNGSDSVTVRYQGSGDGVGSADGSVRDCLNQAIDAFQTVSVALYLTPQYTLQCQSISTLGTQTVDVIHEVETFQVLYGEDTDGNGSVDRYVPADFPNLDWDRVVAVRLALLLRTPMDVSASSSQTSWNVLGYVWSPGVDHKIRRVLTTTLVLNNMQVG